MFYIPCASGTAISPDEVKDIALHITSGSEASEIEIVNIVFGTGSTDSDGKGKENFPVELASETSGYLAPHCRYTERNLRATLAPYIPAKEDIRQFVSGSSLFYMLTEREQKFMHALGGATHLIKQYLEAHDLVPCDFTSRRSDGAIARRLRIFVFDIGSLYDFLDTYNNGHDPFKVRKHTPVDTYIYRCIAEHITFTFKGLIRSEFSQQGTIEKDYVELVNHPLFSEQQVFKGTPFFYFSSVHGHVRAALLIGARTSINVMENQLQRYRSRSPPEKLYGWYRGAQYTPHLRLLDDIHHDDFIKSTKNLPHCVVPSAANQHNGNRSGTYIYTIFDPIDIEGPSVDHTATPFSEIFPLTQLEVEILSKFYIQLHRLLLNTEGSTAESDWKLLLPSNAIVGIDSATSLFGRSDLDWGVVMRYVPLAVLQATHVSRYKLEKLGKFHLYESRWPKSYVLIPPSEVLGTPPTSSHRESLHTGINALSHIETLLTNSN